MRCPPMRRARARTGPSSRPTCASAEPASPNIQPVVLRLRIQFEGNMLPRIIMELERRLLRDIGRAVGDYRLVEDGDRILVAMSGGKDSYAMCVLLRDLQARAPDFVRTDRGARRSGPSGLRLVGRSLTGSNANRIAQPDRARRHLLDRQRQDPRGQDVLLAVLAPAARHPLRVAATRRNKIALGHHRDDILETLLLNLFFGGKLTSMPAKLTSDNGKHVVIRPLVYAAEETSRSSPPSTPSRSSRATLCGSQENAAQADEGAARRMGEEHPKLKRCSRPSAT